MEYVPTGCLVGGFSKQGKSQLAPPTSITNDSNNTFQTSHFSGANYLTTSRSANECVRVFVCVHARVCTTVATLCMLYFLKVLELLAATIKATQLCLHHLLDGESTPSSSKSDPRSSQIKPTSPIWSMGVRRCMKIIRYVCTGFKCEEVSFT